MGDIVTNKVKKKISFYTNHEYNLYKTKTWVDDTPMDDTKVDGDMYVKIDGIYYKRIYNHLYIDYFLRINDNKIGEKYDFLQAWDRAVKYLCNIQIAGQVETLYFRPTETYYFSKSINKYGSFQIDFNYSTLIFPENQHGLVINDHLSKDGYLPSAEVEKDPLKLTAKDTIYKNLFITQKHLLRSAYIIDDDIENNLALTANLNINGRQIEIGDIVTERTSDWGENNSFKVLNELTVDDILYPIALITPENSSEYKIGDIITDNNTLFSGKVSYIDKEQNVLVLTKTDVSEVPSEYVYNGDTVTRINSENSYSYKNQRTQITFELNGKRVFKSQLKFYRIYKYSHKSDPSIELSKGNSLIEKSKRGVGVISVTKSTGININVREFAEAGISYQSSTIGGRSTANNNNTFYLQDVSVVYTGMFGIIMKGGDSNAGGLEHVNVTHSGGLGILDSTFLGTHVRDVHTSICLTGGINAFSDNPRECMGIYEGVYTEGFIETNPISDFTSKFSPSIPVLGGDKGNHVNETKRGAGVNKNTMSEVQFGGSFFTTTTENNGVFVSGNSIKLTDNKSGLYIKNITKDRNVVNRTGSSISLCMSSDNVNSKNVPEYVIKTDTKNARVIERLPVKSDKILLSGGGQNVARHGLVNIMVNQDLTYEPVILIHGEGYTESPVITGTGQFEDIDAEVIINKGEIVDFIINDIPHLSHPNLTVKDAYSKDLSEFVGFNKQNLGNSTSPWGTVYADKVKSKSFFDVDGIEFKIAVKSQGELDAIDAGEGRDPNTLYIVTEN